MAAAFIGVQNIPTVSQGGLPPRLSTNYRTGTGTRMTTAHTHDTHLVKQRLIDLSRSSASGGWGERTDSGQGGNDKSSRLHGDTTKQQIGK